MLDNDKKALIALSGKKEICILPAMANRHGLICGATGTGKSVSLQTMAETFSSLGVPVFLADVKGDLSGMAMPGKSTGKLADRVRELDLEAKGYKRRGFPCCADPSNPGAGGRNRPQSGKQSAKRRTARHLDQAAWRAKAAPVR